MNENANRKRGGEVPKRVPELLAPAGHVESFHAALENGADAVYLGLKRLNARAAATNFTLDELAVLIPYAHKRGALVYVTLNSVVAASELPGVLDLLKSLSDLHADGLIVQDPGVFHLVRKFFPDLPLHGSTLMAVHNHAGVNQLERMGARRVVLARELTLEEVACIAARTRLELEVFIHGALCFSYSGLCLASSFRGGHSGLRGECVQPCRLRFRQGRNEGFSLSCNDLCALALLPGLKKMRIAGFKIEGRMKQADYIGLVVKAYRMVLDAPPESERGAVARAREMLAESPSRRLTAGYLSGDFNAEILTPHRSGSSGLWVGTVKAVKGKQIVVALRRDIQSGDRLRPESTAGKERAAFTVSGVLPAAQGSRPGESAGMEAVLPVEGDFRVGERLFKVGGRTDSASAIWQKIRRETPEGLPYARRFPGGGKPWEVRREEVVEARRQEETLVLKIGRFQELAGAFRSPARWVMLTASRSNLERMAKQRLDESRMKRFVWSLPPLLSEKDIEYYRPAVKWFIEKRFLAWEVNNWGNFEFFPDRGQTRLVAGYRFNLRNRAALEALRDEGCARAVLSVEITGEELDHLGRESSGAPLIVPVHAWPPLFISRLKPRLSEEKPFFTPRKEAYFCRTSGGITHIYGDQPMNWFDRLPLLRSMGFRSFLIDLSEGAGDVRGGEKEMEELLKDFRQARSPEGTSSFNFDRHS